MAKIASHESPRVDAESPGAAIAVDSSADSGPTKSRRLFGWLPWARAAGDDTGEEGEGSQVAMGDSVSSTPSDLGLEQREFTAEGMGWRDRPTKSMGYKAGDATKKVGWSLALWLAAISAVCAGLAVSGYDHGWARLHKDNFTPKTNTYLAIIMAVLTEHPDVAEKVPPGVLDVVTSLLPPVNISIDIELGWLERVLTLDLHSDELSPVIIRFLENPELDPYRDQIHQVAVDRRIIARNLYKDTSMEAQCTGAVVMALLSISIVVSLALLIFFGVARVGKGTAAQRCGWCCMVVLKFSSLLGFLLFACAVAHYVALGYGTHKRTEENIIIEEGFISWPSWAWVFSLVSAALWILAGVLSMKGAFQDPYTLLDHQGIKTFQDQEVA